MAIRKGKKRFEISMEETAYEMISKFATAHHLSKSEFIVCCCMQYIQAVCYAVEGKKMKKKGGK